MSFFMQQFLCVENLTVQSTRVDELLRRTESELTLRYRHLPGYIASSVAKLSATAVISLSFWQTQVEAEQAIKTRNTWMNEAAGTPITSADQQIGVAPFFALTDDLTLRISALTRNDRSSEK